MARHPRPPSPSPPPAPAPSDPDVGFDPVEEWLLDFDQAMASELAKSFGLGEEAVPDAREPTGCDAGIPVPEDGSVSGSGGFGVKPVTDEVLQEKDGLLGLFGAPCGGELDVKKEAVMLTGGLGEQLGSEQLPVLGISDLAAKGDVLERVVDAEMSTVAAVDAEMNSVVSVKEVLEGGGGKGEEETKNEESESSEDEEDGESSEASLSSDEKEQGAKKDEESSEASSSSDEEEQRAKKHGGVTDMEALLEEGELMVGIDDDDEEAPKGPIKSKHEVEVLPPVPKIEVQLEPHHKALPVGTISAIMGVRVIVEGSVQHSPLNEGSILWITESRIPLGIVDELFGPVKNPYYLVRYNSAEEVPAGISSGTAVSFVAEFADHILNMKELYAKGYDESGDHDEEQTDEPEFSDDEKEAEYKRSLRLAKRPTDRQQESKKPSGDKKRAQPRGAGFRKDMPPRTHNAPAPGHRPQHHFHHSDMAPAVADRTTRPSGPQSFPMSAPTMLPPISMNHAMPSAVQLANQMGSCFINPSQQFSPQQPNVVWPGRLPPPLHPNMGVDGAALAANIMQSILIGANQYQQHFQNQNFGGFANGMPVPPPQFMPGSGVPGNPMPFGGPLVNHPFGPASQFPMGQGNFGQLPHMAGNQGRPPGFPNMQGFGRLPSPHGDGDQPPGFPNSQGYGRLPSPHGDGDQPPGFPNPQGYGRLPSPHGDGDQPPMQFNSGQFNQGNSSFRGRRLQQRGGRHSPGRGGGGRHSPGRGGGGRHRK